MAQVWTTGPAHIYVGVLAGSKPGEPVRSMSSAKGMMGDQGGKVETATASSGSLGNQGGKVTPTIVTNFTVFPGGALSALGFANAPGQQIPNSIDAFLNLPNMPKPVAQPPRQLQLPDFLDPNFTPNRAGGSNSPILEPSRTIQTPPPPPPVKLEVQNKPSVSRRSTTVPGPSPIVTRMPAYLGTAEKSAVLEFRDDGEPWYSDEGGNVYPIDDFYAGQEATVTAVLTRYSYFALQRILSKPNVPQGVPGRNRVKDIGDMLGRERGGFILYVDFPNSQYDAMEGLVDGYRFWNAKLVQATLIPGTQAKRAICRFLCKMAFQATQHNQPEAHAPIETVAVDAILYDNDVSLARRVGPN